MTFIRSPIQFGRRPVLRQKRDIREILRKIGLAVIGLFLFGVLATGLTIAIISMGLPDVHDLYKLSVPQSTTIYDSKGEKLYIKHGDENREYVEYDKISPQVIDATIAIEDDKFWEHHGFVAKGIIRAFLNNVLNLTDGQQGGSTITQQYIKKTFLTPKKSLIRKLQELILAVQLEQAFDKKKIIELYLNKIEYGNSAYGIQTAAQIYFNKNARDLDLAESAILASLPKSPTYYNPYGSHLYSMLTKELTPEDLQSRSIKGEADLQDNEFLQGVIGKDVEMGNGEKIYIQGRSDLVLKRMVNLGYITQEQREEALAKMYQITFKKSPTQMKAPNFVEYVLAKLEETYPKEVIEQGGLKVYTTLDLELQEIAEKAVKEGAEKNAKSHNAKNAALLAMDPQTGKILAMVGSKDYYDGSDFAKYNVTTSPRRQPGSSFKPIVYAQAFYQGFSPASVVFDTPTRFGGSSPKNFEGGFKGPMTIRQGLGQSRNITAIKAYYAAGEQKPIVELAKRMGIHFHELEKDPNHDYGWTLALGTAGISLVDMVTAFSVFADSGIRHDPVAILKIENAKGEILEEWKESEGDPVLDPQIAFLINSILSDKDVRLSPNLTIPNQINAAKSGTSNAEDDKGRVYSQDLWTIGYTTKLAAAVWSGNNDPKDRIPPSADGSTLAAPIWKKFMTEALKGTPSENFPRPAKIKEVAVAKASGKLPGPLTPPDQIKNEYFASFAVPTEMDDSYAAADIDMLCEKLANEFTPESMKKKVLFVNQKDLLPKPQWQESADEWLRNHRKADEANPNVIIGPPPTESCPERTAERFGEKPQITIISPLTGSTIPEESQLEIMVQAMSSFGISKVEFYLDDKFKFSSSNSPYTGQVRLPKGEGSGVRHIITAKAYDKSGYTSEVNIEITTTPKSP
jgi:penicillin-binding protein 1A